MSAYSMPDKNGHFGRYGGIFVAETLMRPLQELTQAYEKYMQEPDFLQELDEIGRASCRERV